MMASEQQIKTLAELQKFFGEATFERTKLLLGGEIKKVEAEIGALEALGKAKASSNVKKAVEIKEHAFDQSSKYVKLFIPFAFEAVSDGQCKLEVTETSFNLLIHGSSKDYKFSAVNLLKKVDASQSYVKAKSDMIHVYLKKVKEENWECLTLTEKRLKDQKTKELDDGTKDSSDPMGGLMNVMKKMYDSGDADMKRQIAKAWTEGQEKQRQNPF